MFGLVLAALPGAASAERRAPGGVIVYASVPDVRGGEFGNANAVADLFAVRLDGTAPRRLTRTAWWEYDAAVSPDGRLIAYSQGDPHCHARSCRDPIAASVWVATVDGRRRRPLTGADEAGENDWIEDSASWSPDGTKVAFTRNNNLDETDATNGIYVVGVDGRGLERISRAKTRSLDWSPHASAIAYVHESGRYVALLDLPTRGTRLLRTTGLSRVQSVEWARRGRFLAVATGNAIYVVRAAGGGARKVVEWRGASDVAWAPDGCCLAFSGMRTGARAGRTDLYVVSVRGGRPRRLTSSRGADFDPTWRP